MECLRLALLLLVILQALRGRSGVEGATSSDCPDQYVYTQQPPQEIFVCNPYIAGELKMSCSVLGQNISDIQWWFSPGSDEENITQLTNSSKYALNPKLVTNGLEIQLTVRNLGDEDAGTYWCQASVADMDGVQLLSTSESVELEEKDYFESQLITNACNFVLRNSAFRCASLLVSEITHTVPTTFPEPSTSYPSPVPSPSSTPSPSLPPPPTSLPPTSPPNLTPPVPTKSLFETSAGILYAVLGLVGFLAVVCLLLMVVVIFLCRRRCAGGEMDGSSEKEIGFDQFSNQSDLPLMYKRVGSTQIIHSGTHSRNLSGEYAEIGPALSRGKEHSYSQIGVPHESLPPLPTETGTDADCFQTPGYENPYDLPVFPIEQRHTDVIIMSTNSKEVEGNDSQSIKSHDYHMLEQIVPLNSIPPMSPHHTYHILDDSLPASILCDPNDRVDDVIQQEPPLQLSCDSIELDRLPTIPEHDSEDQRSTERGGCVIKSDQPNDTITPDFTAVDTKDCDGLSETSKDDGEYDRLVDPPHLYHILEHSPLAGRPRIHNFSPSRAGYCHLEETRHTVRRKAQINFMIPQTDVTDLSDSYSSESSLEDDAEGIVFDDPQYFVGPADRNELVRSHKCTHGNPPLFLHQMEPQSDTTLSKYSGDYERDPIYMQQLYSESGKCVSTNKPSSKWPLRAMDDSWWCDDSGFSTYSSLSLQDREKGASLPNLANHVYQSLETKTLEPAQPYEKLKKSGKETPV